MSEVIIRKANPEDLNVLQELNNELGQYNVSVDKFAISDWSTTEEGKTHFQKSINEADRLALIAEADGKPVGFLTGKTLDQIVFRPGKRTEIEIMLVSDNHRGQGIGTQLVEEFINWSKVQGAKRLAVNAYAANERAVKFYKSFGFVPLDINFEKVL